MHSPELGRFVTVDPLAEKYYYNSPYSFSGNRVIDAFELEGLEPVVTNEYSPYYGQVWLGAYDGQVWPNASGQPGMWSESIYNWTLLMDDVNVQSTKIEKTPWITWGYDKPFKIWDTTIFHEAGYYVGPKGFGERGGGLMLANTMFTVGTMGWGTAAKSVGAKVFSAAGERVYNFGQELLQQGISKGDFRKLDWANAGFKLVLSNRFSNKFVNQLVVDGLSSTVDFD